MSFVDLHPEDLDLVASILLVPAITAHMRDATSKQLPPTQKQVLYIKILIAKLAVRGEVAKQLIKIIEDTLAAWVKVGR
ncbi:hypothetical protein [Pseudoalteromonas sp. Of7M-16]|uniref:hypothetical protein n=1 Tax=Pseudoalteromonas sp. Of7M-16 TaxID=2917756 RepID=UPI001EF5E3DB|nr:hypothetical protein [Pseudoalteromonas sp. Of7M-16]MCG7546969.1 hypothetical protein [Pseudoalteromonas sp. Of7M-16]